MSLFYSSVVDMHADQMLLSSYSLDLCDVWYRWTLTTFSQSRHRVNGSNDETGTTRACSLFHLFMLPPINTPKRKVYVPLVWVWIAAIFI